MKTCKYSSWVGVYSIVSGLNLQRLLLSIVLVALSAAGADGARVRSFPIPTGSQPINIVQGPDGNLWFTLQNSSQIARITPEGVITEFRTHGLSFPFDITVGPDRNIWFSEGSTGRIGFIRPGNEHITEIMYSNFGVSAGITGGPDGNIWFTDITDNAVYKLDLVTQNFSRFVIPTPNAFPNDITRGRDGNLWFTESVTGKVGRITPDGVMTEFETGVDAVGNIVSGPDGNLWFVVRFNPRIGRITPQGDITFFPTPNNPEQLGPGIGNTLYFSEFGANKVAQITMDGVVTESPLVPHSEPTGITAGENGSVWFLGFGDNKVYRSHFPP